MSAQSSCALDNSFSTDGMILEGTSRYADYLAYQGNDKIIVGANKSGNGNVHIKRVNADGTPDGTFGNGGIRSITVDNYRTAILGLEYKNGYIYIAGVTTTTIGGTTTYAYLAKLDSNGAFVPSFGTNGIKKYDSNPKINNIEAMTLDQDGNILATGLQSQSEISVMKFDQNSGSLMTTFDIDGISKFSSGNSNHYLSVKDIALDNSNNIIVSGSKYLKANAPGTFFQHVFVGKMNSNGVLDQNFGGNGTGTYSLANDPGHEGLKVLVNANNDYFIAIRTYYPNAAYTVDFSLLKLNSSGAEDLGFANNGWAIYDLDNNVSMDVLQTASILPDERILMSGSYGDGDTTHFALLMLKPDGSRDLNFAPDGYFIHVFNANNGCGAKSQMVQPNGKIVLGGMSRTCANGVCGPIFLSLSRYTFDLGAPLGIDDLNSLEKISVYPNPGNSGTQFKIISEAKIQNVSLYDLQGRMLAIERINETFETNSKVGNYLLLIETENGIHRQILSIR